MSRIRTAYNKNCEICGIIFTTIPSSSKQSCCSKECSNKKRMKNRVKFICLNCGSDIYDLKRKSGGRKYCSTKCKIESLAKSRKERYKNSRMFLEFKDYRELKKYLIDFYNGCQCCGWDKEKMVLELHHKDRNRKNNNIDNVMLLCPNCHTIKHLNAKDGQFKNNYGVKNAINENRAEGII